MFVFRCCSFKLHKVSLAVHSNIIKRKRVIGLFVAYHRSYSKLPVVSVRATPVTYSETATVTYTTDTTKEDDTNNNDFAIDHQKKRAIQYWNESELKYTEELKEQVHDDVMQHLQEGKVLPIFHTLCRPPTERLFPLDTRVSVEDPNSDIIQLSSDPVTMGECNEESELVGKLSMKEERSYLTSFFTNQAANFIVKDMSFNWEFDDDYTKIVTDLVNAPADMVGEDIEVTKLVKPFAVDKFSGRNLITRSLSRGVVADCFSKSKAGSTYAIVGNPGIGKSWTLIYALQQALLYENACVLFCEQKDGNAMVCLRRNNKIYVWRSNDDRWESKCSSNLFQNSNVLVLLDPLESKEGGARFTQGRRMLLMAASNNANHFGATGKFTPFFARFLSLYADRELKVAVPFMAPYQGSSLSVDVIMMRAKSVGNLPRYIMSEESFKNRLQETYNSIAKLEKKEMKLILSINGLNETQGIVYGCIFAVNVNTWSSKSDSDTNIDEDTGNGTESDEDSGTELEEDDAGTGRENIYVGYDGQDVVNYGDVAVNIISSLVLSEMIKLSRQDILSFWGKTSSSSLSNMGDIIEDLFWEDLNKRYQMRTFPLKKKGAKPEKAAQNVTMLDIGKCEYIENISINELGQKVFDKELNTAARIKEKAALIDFAGPGLRVYQVTVSNKHSMVVSGLKELFIQSGHGKDVKGTFKVSEVAEQIGNISFYWVIPKEKESLWKKKASVKKRKKETSVEIAYCLEKYVDQYILVLDDFPTSLEDNMLLQLMKFSKKN